MSWKLQLSSMKSWMRREEVRSPAGQPAAMQEKGWAALGPRRGFVEGPVWKDRDGESRCGKRVKRGRTCLILARWPHRSRGSGWPMVAETCVSCRFSHLCVMLRLLGNWVPLLSRTPNSTCSFQACTWRPNFVHQKPCPNTIHFGLVAVSTWASLAVCVTSLLRLKGVYGSHREHVCSGAASGSLVRLLYFFEYLAIREVQYDSSLEIINVKRLCNVSQCYMLPLSADVYVYMWTMACVWKYYRPLWKRFYYICRLDSGQANFPMGTIENIVSYLPLYSTK